MKDRNIKERIDTELNMIKVNEKMNVDNQQYIADDHSIEEVVKKDSSSNLSYFNAWGNNSSSWLLFCK